MSANLRIGTEVSIQAGERQSLHVIVARRASAASRSGVQYRLLPGVTPEWIDADQVRKAKGFGSNAELHVDPFEVEL